MVGCGFDKKCADDGFEAVWRRWPRAVVGRKRGRKGNIMSRGAAESWLGRGSCVRIRGAGAQCRCHAPDEGWGMRHRWECLFKYSISKAIKPEGVEGSVLPGAVFAGEKRRGNGLGSPGDLAVRLFGRLR